MIKLLFLSLVGSLMGLLLMLLRRKSKGRISSGFFYWAWLMVLLRFALPAPGLVPIVRVESAPAYTIRENYAPRQEVFLPESEAPLKETAPELPAAAEVMKTETKKSFDFEKLLSWELIWLGGAAFVILKQSTAYLIFSRKLRKTLEPVNDFELWQYISVKQRPKPEIAKSRAVNTPMILGLKNPLLVLPKREYSFDDFNNIMLHEFTHYRRGDVVLKWLTMFIFAFHWFNPLCRLFVKELDTVCELSCDEKLLKNMDSRQKRSYGETLLELAGGNSLKSGTPATCLAMEKRVLKERLEQIMKYKNRGKAFAAVMLLCLVILGGCAAAVGPDTSPEVTKTPETPGIANDVHGTMVHNADELLAAIEPGASIILAEGTFNLTEAENYGIDSEHYNWYEMADGYELRIVKADGLSIIGAGIGKSSIVTEPRAVDVLSFVGGENISLAGFTAGHTEAAGHCMGDVISLDGVKNAHIDSCDLFGCGCMGVVTSGCQNVLVENSVIRDCSGMAVYSQNCYNVQVENCEIYNCADGGFLMGIHDTFGFVLSNSRIHDNLCADMFSGSSNKDMKLLGNKFYDNTVSGAVFFVGNDILVEGCSFKDTVVSWYADDTLIFVSDSASGSVPRALDAQGNILEAEDLVKMKHSQIDYSFGDVPESAPSSEIREVAVKTVDELLAAIAPNTRIILEGELFDMSTASDYGNGGNEWYFWRNCFDGSELVVSGVENLSIVGQGKDKTTLAATPRYADVINFENCAGIELVGFTAGHTEMAGYCSGGVLYFRASDELYIEDCGLFGCGTTGIYAEQCRDIEVVKSDIYDCSIQGFYFTKCSGVEFTDCSMWGLPETAVHIGDTEVRYNGQLLGQGSYALEDGSLKKRVFEVSESEALPAPELGDFRIWFGQLPIVTDCTMRVGDEPIRFFAGRSTVGDITDEEVVWSASKPDVLELDPGHLGYFCGVEVINAVKGGVELTATRGDESATITIYCLP
ncbi:MAG: right-handed parallel beta-helix repeat-containing protein [Oscillospiraceae bacterium]|nr:right-handed parallel beta-helix repeat-containing protein [Oscillospiraceae bacterium]